MRILKKFSIAILAVAFIFGFTMPVSVRAATNPNLGAAESFSVLASTLITGTPISISGDIGNVNAVGGASITGITGAVVAGIIYAQDLVAPSEAIIAPTVQSDASTAYTTTAGLAVEGTPIAVSELGGITRGSGVYDIPGNAILSSGVLTLDGPGTYIFRTGPASSLTSSAGGSINFINGARPCDLFWNIGTAAEIGGTSFAGTILASTGIHFTNAGVALNGRALAIGADVTLNVDGSISGPTCPVPPVPLASPTLVINKVIINDDSGTKLLPSDFSLKLDGGAVTHGAVNTTTVGLHTVSETADSGYTTTIGGDCAADGTVTLALGDIKTCTITNDDVRRSSGGGSRSYTSSVPPLIDVVKVPSPLALSDGPGAVTYTYTLRNIGTVPVTDITMVGDTCSPIILNSGDTNADSKLDITETWVYKCSTTLSETHTNIVTTTGWANGISAIDVASATVVVGVSIVPPLIHITKVPSPLALLSGAGTVTYKYTVTNPGTVPLSNVNIVDDKCTGLPGRVTGHPGDLNKNNLLESNESWSFTCKSKLTKTTTNTATASGDANGLTAKDFAFATVVVTNVPGLPKTGFGPENNIVSLEQEQINLATNKINAPVRIKIPSIGVDALIESVGFTIGGAVDVPKGPTNAGWFDEWPRPGEKGNSILAGHSGWKNGIPAVFDNLYKVQKGDKIYIEDSKGRTISFVVRGSQKYDPKANALDVFYSNDGKSHLSLITCVGFWNKIWKSHSDRLVVFADKE